MSCLPRTKAPCSRANRGASDTWCPKAALRASGGPSSQQELPVPSGGPQSPRGPLAWL